MAAPEWITPAGSLGTIPEGIYYQLTMLATPEPLIVVNCTATDGTTNTITCNSTAGMYPDLEVYFSGNVFGGLQTKYRYFVLNIVNSTQFRVAVSEFETTPVQLSTATGTMTASLNQHVYFNLQAGKLPSGIQVSDNGLLIGTPKAVASIQGVPTEVSRDVTSKFTVRAYTQNYINNRYVLDQLRDRTFTLTVTGPDAPEWVTPSGQIAEVYDGSLVTGIQLQYTDQDTQDTVTTKLVAGTLPTGLTLSRSGLITGFIQPLSPVDATAGFSRDGQGFAEYGFDFSTQSYSSNFQFTVELTDGVNSNLRTFSIYVVARNSLTADNTVITADTTFITADVTPVRPPIVLNPQGSIGTVRNDDWYAYQFIGLDLDGDQFRFELIYDIGDSAGIPGLQLDPGSGWLYGYIPPLGITELTYNFGVRIYKLNSPDIFSDYFYSLNIIGPISSEIVWTTPTNLGTINNGATSTLYVKAVNTAGLELQYQLLSGSDSSLPQGLQLLPSGDIAGRVSFNTFALDGGTTTFDVTNNDLAIKGQNTETTFDLKFTFTVQAFSLNGVVNVSKQFSITVVRAYNEPYENLYIQAMPPENDRVLINDLLQNADIFPQDLIYRPTDPNFGVANQVVYYHAFGLNAVSYADYVSSLYQNHYWKNLTLGEIKVAQARDRDGNVIYEVVYSKVIDNLLNEQGQSVSKQVTLPYPINEGDSTEIDSVYPNSLINMRDQVIDVVGQVGNILPLWMTSKQANGKVLGFTPAWPIAYVKPGKGNQIAYYIKEQFGERLNLIDFEVDRYELDRLLTKNWDPVADSTYGAWEPAPAETYFDLGLAGTDISWLNETGDAVGWINEDAFSVDWVNNYTGNQTIFDGGSMRFIAPVDMYSNTQEYDKYLVFPRRNILG
jgi:hypothetical protein